MPITGGPYLAGAFFCERVLREGDGVLSAIRIVDRWTVSGTAEKMPVTIISATLLIMLKSGIYRGSGNIFITPISPSHVRMQPVILPVVFGGDDDAGVAVGAPMGFPVQEDDVYWFEIGLLLSGEATPTVLTCTPMRVAYQRIFPTPPQLPSSPQELGQG